MNSPYAVINQWPKTSKARSYRLFAERCRELVSPAADDNYRVHALSTPMKFAELWVHCHRTLEGNLPKKSLDPIIEEIREAVQNEPVMNEVFSNRVDVMHMLPKLSDTIDEMSSKADLIRTFLRRDYVRNCQELIEVACESEEGRNRIPLLAKLLVSELVCSGHSRRYVLEMVERHFFNARVARCDKHLLRRFFLEFSGKRGAYEVVVVGDAAAIKTFEAILPISKQLDRVALAKDRYKDAISTRHLRRGEMALGIPDIEASDPYVALKASEELLTFQKAHHLVYPSAPRIQLKDTCYVISKEGATTELKRSAARSSYPSETARRYVPSNRNFAKFLTERLRHRSAGNSFQALRNAFGSATLSSDSSVPEARLLGVWSAFESLLPPPSREDREKARILHFVDLIAPAATHRYMRGKFRIAHDVCCDVYGKEFERLIRDHGLGRSYGERLASILVGDGSHIDILMGIVGGSPLISNRLTSLRAMLIDPKRAVEKIRKHEERVRWQIHRIYRERNSIVHSGSPSPHLNVLVENAELYFRLTVRSLEQTVVDHGVHDPHSALQYIAALKSTRIQELEAVTRKRLKNPGRAFVRALFA